MSLDIGAVSNDQLWEALAAASESIKQIGDILSTAMTLPDGPKMTTEQAVAFRAQHWKTLWAGALEAVSVADRSPAELKAILGIDG